MKRPKPLFSFTKPATLPLDKDGEIKVQIDPRLLPDRPMLNMPEAGPLLAHQRIRKPRKPKPKAITDEDLIDAALDMRARSLAKKNQAAKEQEAS